MSNRAQIAIQIGPEEWAHVYVHFDGYPAHMLPALARWKPKDILTAREIRQLTPEALDCFSPPRDPHILPRPTREFAHLYMWIGCQWLHVRTGATVTIRQALILLGSTYTSRPTRAMVITQKRCNSPKDYHAMTTRRATDNSETGSATGSRNRSNALDAFMTAKFQIDAMLERLKALSDDHFDAHADAVHWGDVGTLNHYSSPLRQITDAAFKEGEHAA